MSRSGLCSPTSVCSGCCSRPSSFPKLGLVFPLARRYIPRHATFATLLMSTGLTFGTIASLYGLTAGIIDETQFSLLVTVVVGSAVIPTAIAQTFFHPIADLERREAPIPAEEYV